MDKDERRRRAQEIRDKKNPKNRRARAEQINADSPRFAKFQRVQELERRIRDLENVLRGSSLAKWEHVKVSKALAKKHRQLERLL